MSKESFPSPDRYTPEDKRNDEEIIEHYEQMYKDLPTDQVYEELTQERRKKLREALTNLVAQSRAEGEKVSFEIRDIPLEDPDRIKESTDRHPQPPSHQSKTYREKEI